MMRPAAAIAVAVAGLLPQSAARLGPDRAGEPERLVVSIEERGGLGATHLWLLDLSEPDVPRRLTSGAVVDQSPAVSPDGRWVAFSRAPGDAPAVSRIWLRSMINGAERPVTQDPSAEPSWSPNGRQILFTHGEGTNDGRSVIKTLDPFGASARAEPVLPSGSPSQSNGSWHPRGDGLVFTMVSGEGRAPFAIWRRVGTSEPEEVISRGCCGVHRPAYSPDGPRLAYVSFVHDDFGDIYVADADGSNR